MSSVAVDATRPARDPGRMYLPPPVTRAGAVIRWGLSGLFALMGLGLLALGARDPRGLGSFGNPWVRFALDLALTVVAGVLMTMRRRRPMVVTGAILVISTVSLGAGGFVPWAFVSLCTRRRWREVVPMGLLFLVCPGVATFAPWIPGTANIEVDGQVVATQRDAATWVVTSLFMVLWVAVYTGFGFYVGARRDLVASLTERAETAEREQALMVAAGQARERSRIAREMHDVLAHRISLVSMHAGVLAYRDDLEPAQTKQIAGIIQENAHASLTELRQVLSTLRESEPLGAGVEDPQPTLDNLAPLVREMELTGVRVQLDNQIQDPGSVPAPLARHAYRMVQEALTNARKHAVGAPITVSLSGRAGRGLSLEARNPLTGAGSVPGSRLGLVGLAERAQLLGGTFSAGPQHGDYVVEAWFPWEK